MAINQTDFQKSIVLTEGMVDWIMERESAEERLAAWDTIVAIAFEQEEFNPPAKAANKKLSKVERTQRDVYLLFKDIIQGFKPMSGTVPGSVPSSTLATPSTVTPPILPKETDKGAADAYNSPVGDTWRSGFNRRNKPLTNEEQIAIAEWDKKIPHAEALQEYLKTNYYLGNRSLVATEEFCQFAYHRLKSDSWLSSKTGKPLKNISSAIHYLALDYKEKCGEARRTDEKERKRDMEMEFEMQSTVISNMSERDHASLKRIRDAQAEKLWQEQVMRRMQK